jgi:hypothetical protein
MQKKPLTGWLILLIIILGPVTFGQASSALANMDRSYSSFMATYPSLPLALSISKLLIGTSVCVSIYTAWVLYRRRPGSLGIAQAGLVFRAAFMIISNIPILMLSGFPADLIHGFLNQFIWQALIYLLITGVWYLYLIRSKRVKEIFSV